MLTKKSVFLLTLILVISSLFFTVNAAESFVGEAEGHNGPVKIEVFIENQEIQKIDVLESEESDFTEAAFEQLTEEITENNSTSVDIVSGATVTSKAIITAVENALAKAGVILNKTVATKTNENKNIVTDVVVVGGGGAGLSAAIEAKNQGVDVVLVEKNAILGGNTAYATGGLNAAETEIQKENGIEDSVELFFEDTMKGGKQQNNSNLVKILTNQAKTTVAWLRKLGADLTDVGRLGGASANRAHRPTGGAAVGSHLVGVLEENAESSGVEIKLNTKAVEILNNNTEVTGIVVENEDGNYTIKAKAVIIATGGFGANPEKVVKFDNSLEGFGTTNAPGATGDAIDFLSPLNVSLIDMDEIQTHPTVVPEKNKMITEAVRGNGAILVNREAKRFVNELETRDVVSEAELDQEGQSSFLIFDQNIRESLSAIESYYKAGLLVEAKSIKNLAVALDINAEQLSKTISSYNEFVNNGDDKNFNREDMASTLSKAPYYAVEVGPAVHHTMGGIEINKKTEVLNKNGQTIKGLYAAGEVTGGIHGANRLGGNALADVATFGRIAGENAAKFVK